MAVKVISQEPVDYREIVCPNCRYKLAFTPADVKESRHTDFAGDTDTYYSINCPRPECKYNIPLKSKF